MSVGVKWEVAEVKGVAAGVKWGCAGVKFAVAAVKGVSAGVEWGVVQVIGGPAAFLSVSFIALFYTGLLLILVVFNCFSQVWALGISGGFWFPLVNNLF